MTVRVGEAIDALDRLIASVDLASVEIVKKGADTVKREAQVLAPKRSSALADSIVAEPPTNVGRRYGMMREEAGPYFWTARVGPTVVYGRIRELGGKIPGPRGMAHPYLKWYWMGRPVFKRQVKQSGTKYLLRATDSVEPRYMAMATRRWAIALETR